MKVEGRDSCRVKMVEIDTKLRSKLISEEVVEGEFLMKRLASLKADGNKVMGWPKSLFGFFHYILWKTRTNF